MALNQKGLINVSNYGFETIAFYPLEHAASTTAIAVLLSRVRKMSHFEFLKINSNLKNNCCEPQLKIADS